MIAVVAAFVMAAPPIPTPPAGRAGPDTCAAGVLMEWGASARRRRGRTGTPAELRALSQACDDAGARHNIDPDFLRAIAWVESRASPRAVSRAGARGPFQIMVGTARAVLPREVTRRDVLNLLHDPARVAVVAALLLRRMEAKWGRGGASSRTPGRRAPTSECGSGCAARPNHAGGQQHREPTEQQHRPIQRREDEHARHGPIRHGSAARLFLPGVRGASERRARPGH